MLVSCSQLGRCESRKKKTILLVIQLSHPFLIGTACIYLDPVMHDTFEQGVRVENVDSFSHLNQSDHI